MERFVKGDVVVIPFPFSDLSNTKRRPAVIVANITGDDLILVQITSQNIRDSYAIRLFPNDVLNGSFNQISNIRPNKLFTLDRNIIIKKIGTLSETKLNELTTAIVDIITN